MKRISYLIISTLLLISFLTSCSTINETKGTPEISAKSQTGSTDGTVTYPLHIIARENTIDVK